MTSRREALKKLFNSTLVAGSGGLLWGTVANGAMTPQLALRPPGAVADKDFIQACIKCGKCVEACPYDTLKLGGVSDKKGIGTPYFEPRKTPCFLCTNYPCTKACPSGALSLENLNNIAETPNIENARMGLAVVHKESCIAFSGIQCDACYRSCPLMGQAIVLEKDKNEFTGMHANLKPVVNSDACTGCGICEQVCVVEKSAIFVLPLSQATGKLGYHYVKSWEHKNNKHLHNKKQEQRTTEVDVESAIDYLNSDDELFD